MVVHAGGAWERALGELLTSAEARVLLGGISREALRKRVVSGSVIALRDDAGLIRYPRWQFDAASGAPFAAVKELTGVFGDAGLDSWTLASFATAPQPELGNRPPVDSFADVDIEPLLLSAHRTVADLKRCRGADWRLRREVRATAAARRCDPGAAGRRATPFQVAPAQEKHRRPD